MTERIDRMIQVARENICSGIVQEPRVMFDEITINDDGAERFSSSDVFKNGEAWPIHITLMSVAIRGILSGVLTDERLIHRLGLRLHSHDHYYMRRDFVAVPAWQTFPVGGPLSLGFSTSHWAFERPLVLSARDALAVQVQLDVDPTNARNVVVSFTGYGLETRRPYFFASHDNINDALLHNIVADRFRNDGDEPVILTDMTCYVSAETTDNNPQGNIRVMRLQVRQVGNGTQANWFLGPVSPTIIERCPAVLLGLNQGRAVVHTFPQPLIWEPGEGLDASVQALNTTDFRSNVVQIAFCGYITRV